MKCAFEIVAMPPSKSLHEPPGVSVTRLADATRAPDTGARELKRYLALELIA
jgi:hypothetical protein